VPDKESDIRPRFYRPKTRSIEHMGDDVSFSSFICIVDSTSLEIGRVVAGRT